MLPEWIASLLPSEPTRRLIYVVVSINAGSHFMLYLDGVVDNLLPAAHSFLIKNYGNEEEGSRKWELMVSLRMYGLALGCLLATILSKSWGRKPQVLLGLILNIIGVVLTSIIMYIPGGLTAAHLGRFVNGCGQGLCQTAGTVMLLELPPRRCRGTVLATMTFFACMGELLSMLLSLEELLGNSARWDSAMAVPIVLLLPATFVIAFSPESPRYLFSEGRQEEAVKSLEFYQTPSDARKTIADMKAEISHDDMDINANAPLLKMHDATIVRTEARTWKRMRESSFMRPLLVACVLQSFVHLDDWLWVSYSTHIFALHGFKDSMAQKASLVMTFPQAILSLGLVSIFEKFPRKALVVLPTLISAAIGFATIITIQFTHVSGTVAISSCLLPFLASLDLSMAAIAGESALSVAPELFLYKDRIIGTAISGVMQSLFGGVLLNCLLSAINHFGAQRVFIPFVIGNLFYAVFTCFYVPETAKKSPQEVADALDRIFTRRPSFVEGLRSLSARFSSFRFSQVIVFLLQLLCLLVVLNLLFSLFSSLFPSAANLLMAPDQHILHVPRH